MENGSKLLLWIEWKSLAYTVIHLHCWGGCWSNGAYYNLTISTRMKNIHHLFTHSIKVKWLTKDLILQVYYTLESGSNLNISTITSKAGGSILLEAWKRRLSLSIFSSKEKKGFPGNKDEQYRIVNVGMQVDCTSTQAPNRKQSLWANNYHPGSQVGLQDTIKNWSIEYGVGRKKWKQDA